jgi:hypothetical protein
MSKSLYVVRTIATFEHEYLVEAENDLDAGSILTDGLLADTPCPEVRQLYTGEIVHDVEPIDTYDVAGYIKNKSDAPWMDAESFILRRV